MAKKTKLIKNLLTTASALTLLTAGASNALGAGNNVTTNGGNVANLANGTDSGGQLSAQFDNGGGIQYDGNHTIATAGDVIIRALDIENHNPGNFTINHNVTLGSVFSTTNGGVDVDLVFGADNKTLILSGTPGINQGVDLSPNAAAGLYNKLDNIDINNNANTAIVIDTRSDNGFGENGAVAAVTLTGNINNLNGGVSLSAKTDLTTTSITWAAVKDIEIGTAANAAKLTLNAAANADTGILQTANSTMEFLHDDSTLILKNNDGAGGAGGTYKLYQNLAPATDVRGKVEINANGNAAVVGVNAAETLGESATKRLKELKVSGNDNVTIAAKVFAKDIDVALTNNKDATFTGGFDTGADGKVKITQANTAKVVILADSRTGTFDLNGKDKIVEIGSAATNPNFAGDINAQVAAAPPLAAASGTVDFIGDSEYTGTMTNIKLVQVANNKTVTLKSNGAAVNNTIKDVQLVGANSVLTIEDGVNIGVTVGAVGGHINEGGGLAGTINFDGSSVIAGNVGTNAFGTMNIKGGAGKTVEIAGNVNGANVKFITNDGGKLIAGKNITAAVGFTKDGIIEFAGDVDHDLTGAITTDGPADKSGIGTIVVAADVASNRTVTLDGQIGDEGDDAKALKLLKLDPTAADANALTVELTGGSAHIKKIEIAGADTKIELNEAGETYRIGSIDTANAARGKLEVNQNVTLQTDATDVADKTNLLNGNRYKSVKVATGKDLTLEDGAVLVGKAFESDGNNAGLVFEGDAVFGAKELTGTVNKLEIQAGAANKTVHLLTNMDAAGNNINLKAGGAANAGNLAFYGTKLTAANIQGAGGVLKLSQGAASGTEAQEINAAVAGDVKVQFDANRDVKFSKASSSNSYTFNNGDGITVDFGNSNVDDANFTISEGKAENNLVKIKAGSDLKQNLGGAKVLSFEAAGDLKVESVSANAEKAKFSTSADNARLTLESTDASATIGGIERSSNDKLFENVDFKKNYTVTGDSEAGNFNVFGDKTVIFSGNVAGEVLNLTAADAKVEFNKDGLEMNVAVKNSSGTADTGEVKFGDVSATLKKQIGDTGNGKLKMVSFAADGGDNRAEWKTTTLEANIHAATVDFKKQNVALEGDVTVDGNVSFAGSALNLGSKTLTSVGGDAAFSGAVELTSRYVNDAESGKLINSEGGLTFAEESSLKITVEGDPQDGIARGDASITILESATDINDENTKNILEGIKDITVTGNTFVDWTPSFDGKKLVLKRLDVSDKVFAERVEEVFGKDDIRSSKAKELFAQLKSAAKGTGAANFADSMSGLSKERTAEATERFMSEASTAMATNQVAENASAVVGTRLFNATVPAASMGDIISPEYAAAAVADAGFDGVGVAAGDDHDRFGVWASPFMSSNTQKARKGATGYKSDSYGLTAGFDAKANDDLVVGIAGTIANTDVKHKDGKRDDKTTIDSYLFSIYGVQQLTTNWFLQGAATIGHNSVKNKSLRVLNNTVNETATGQYSSMLMSGELMTGYNHMISSVTVTPMAGVRFGRVNDSGYSESGTTSQNFEINKKAANKFEVVGGLRVSALAYDMDGVTMSPEIHGFVNHDLVNKNPDVDVKIDGVSDNLAQLSAKPVRTFYNVGAGLNSTYANMEYGIAYDAHIADKYVGHQGTLKIRVNF